MATPKTQGFSLSALPRSPSIPNKIGMIDVKAIDDGVRRGLATMEMIRRAPQEAVLADEAMATDIAKNQAARAVLPAQTDATLSDLRSKSDILAAQASPEYLDAQRQALLNKSVKTPAGDIQLANALAQARIRMAEDPSDLRAAELVRVLEPMVANKSAATFKDPQGIATMTNDTRRDVAAGTNETRRDIAGATNELAREKLTQDATLRREGFGSAQDVARINAQGRVDASRAANTAKLYEVAAADNQRLQGSLASLAVIEDKIDAYRESALGSGPIVGTDAALFVRNLFGDPSGQQLKAAVSQEMANAVQAIRGLGAMSDTEFKAVMDQLPRTTDVGEALETKLEYMKALRPWLTARSNMYLSEIERGSASIAAHEKVRRAFPMPGIGGTAPVAPLAPATAPSQTASTPAPTAAPTSFATPAEAEAAGQRGELANGQEITVAGRRMRWTQ